MLNWLTRYAPVRDLMVDAGGTPRTSILDVGSGAHGASFMLDDLPFAGLDVVFDGDIAPTTVALRADPGPLPFVDQAFGLVLSLDALEHIPVDEREGFVAQLARVSADRVVIACPSSELQPTDDYVRDDFLRRGEPLPAWLAEHYEEGLPTPESIEAAVRSVPGFTAEPLPMPNGLLATMINAIELTPPFADEAAAEFARDRDRWTDLIAGATFGPSWRKAWLLRRDPPGEPVAGPVATAASVAGALRCTQCSSTYELIEDDAMRCTGCARLVFRSFFGVWDLAEA
jgi:hypothetical protein